MNNIIKDGKFESPAQEEAYNRGRIEHIRNMDSDTSAQNNIDNSPETEYTVNEKNQSIDSFGESSVERAERIETYIEGTVEEAYSAVVRYLANEKGVYEAYPKTFHQYNDLYNQRHPSSSVVENVDYTSPEYETSETRKPIVATDLKADKQRRSDAAKQYGLSVDEARRLGNYVGGQLCYILNERMIKGTLVDGDLTVVNDIRNALLKLPEYSGRTYRNLKFTSEEQYNNFLSEHTEGNTVELKAFTSASKLPNGYPLIGNGVVHLVIDGVSGRDISETFGLPRQQEVVYLPSTKIEIKKVTIANDGNPLIFAQEVASSENIRTKETGSVVNNRPKTSIHQNIDRQRVVSDRDGANHNGVSEEVQSRNGRYGILSQRGKSADIGNVLGEQGRVKEIQKNGQLETSTEKHGNILQQVQIEKELHGNLHEVSERNTGRGVDTENSVQGVRTDNQGEIKKDVSAGETFTDTKTGSTIIVISRDENNTVVEIDNGNEIVRETYSNEQADYALKAIRESFSQSTEGFDQLESSGSSFIDDSVIDYNNTSAEGKVNWKDLSKRQRAAITFVKGIAKATGMNLVLIKDGYERGINGSFNVTRDTITLDVFAGINQLGDIDTILPTMSHEITHWMKNKSIELYRKMDSFIFKTLRDQDGISEADRIDAELKRMRERSPGEEFSVEDARDEIIARACEDMLSMSETGKQLFNNLSEGERKTFINKVKDLIRKLAKQVDNLLSSYDSNSVEAVAMRKYKENLTELLSLWDKAFDESIKTSQNSEQSINSSKEVVQMQARQYDQYGNAYWQIESEKDIFKGITNTKELRNAAYNFILRGDKGEKIVDLIDGEKLEFIRISAKEYVYGKASQSLSEQEYKQKMRMSTSIIDLIDNASIDYDSPDHKNHKLFPRGFKNYQGRVGIDETIFRYIVRVGKAKNGSIFYDINLEVDGKVPRANRTSLIKSSTSTNSISNSDKKINEQNVKNSGASTSQGKVQNSVREIVGQSGKNYGVGVYLDSNIFDGLNPIEKERKAKSFVVDNLAGKSFVAYDNDNNEVEIEIAKADDSFRVGYKSRSVLPALYQKAGKKALRQESVALTDELISAARYSDSVRSTKSHGWIDRYGKNDWDYWTVYIQEQNGNMWKAVLNIANTKDGKKLLYEIDPFEPVEVAKNTSVNTEEYDYVQNSSRNTASTRKENTEQSLIDLWNSKIAEYGANSQHP